MTYILAQSAKKIYTKMNHAVQAILLVSLLLNSVNSYAKTPKQSQFLEAIDAIKTGDRQTLSQLKVMLKDYPLYPYILYYDYRKNIDKTPESLLKNFIEQPHHMADKLRQKWLTHLAKKQKWSQFLATYQNHSNQTLQCNFVRAAYAKGSDSEKQQALALAKSLWTQTVTLRKDCAKVDTLLRQHKQLNPSLIWQRINHVITQKGGIHRARYLKRDLSKSDQKIVDTWIRWIQNPILVTRTLPDHMKGIARTQALEDALEKLARKNPALTLKTLDKFTQNKVLSSQKIIRLQRLASLNKAYGYKDSAEQALDELHSDGGATKTSLRWKAQIDIKNSDWPDLIKVIEQMPPEQKNSAKWRYWKARTLEQLGQKLQAQKLYKELANQRSYYGFLAADKLRLPYRFNAKTARAISEKELINKYPGLLRIKELISIDWQQNTNSEWNSILESASDDDVVSIAQYAHTLEQHAIAIRGMALAKQWNIVDVRFPTPYKGMVVQSSQTHNVDPAWVYGIIRRESAYNEKIRSGAGALGLMQIMPKTARWIGKKNGIRRTDPQSLMNAEKNIELGSAYISYLNKKYHGNPVMATAAYNAGPHRVNSWASTKPMRADQWIDTIPFTETRKYVKAVLEYRTLFQSILNQKQQRISDWMPDVVMR
jgi:soluble lytic murein transglycosylase